MSKHLRTILAVVVGFVVGSVVNMALIAVSGNVIPPPAGTNASTMAGLNASMHLFEARHFIFPFLAHALGTLFGALAASWVAPGSSRVAAYTVAGLFLAGGIASAVLLPAPAWFVAADLMLAYLPTAWLGQVLATRLSGHGIARE